MSKIIFSMLLLVQYTLSLTTDHPVNPVPHSNCTIDNDGIKKKVVEAMDKAVKNLFEDSSWLRRRRSSADNFEVKSEIHDEQIPYHGERIDSIVPIEFSRTHEPLAGVQKLIHSRGRRTVNSLDPLDNQLTLSRTKRFCVPISYDEEVQRLVRKVVHRALKNVSFL